MRSTVLVATLLAACSSVPPISTDVGRGVIAVDRAVPADGSTAPLPQWRAGDWFRYRRGGETHSTVRVDVTEDTNYQLVEDTNGRVTTLDLDLGRLAEEMPGLPYSRRELAPADSSWSWPLWVDKRWTCHFMRKAPGTVLPVLAEYHCDARETVTVPAGTFECYRVWRRARPAVEERFFENVSVAWYAPEVGWFVRQLEEGVLFELDGYHRQQ